MISLEKNLQAVQARIAAAATRVARHPAEITLVAVTKGQPPEVIRAAYDLGLRHYGENRVEEAEAKVGHLPRDITWHMIGHIQSRKAKRVVPHFQIIHSLDSIKLARRLSRLCADRADALPVLLEVNVSGEKAKYGFTADQWPKEDSTPQSLFSAVEQIAGLAHIQVQGLMTMAPIVTSAEQARPVFARLRQLRDALATAFPQLNWHHLSMGMTDDFEVAIEEGATMVRVGRAIFAPQQGPWRTG